MPGSRSHPLHHYSLSPADLLEIQIRRREHNQLGFAIQLSLMRYPGRPLLANEVPPKAMLDYVAGQVGASRRKLDRIQAVCPS
jgi:TnpA family transposase